MRHETRGEFLLTETVYAPGVTLPEHSHGSEHLAILVEGCYLERVGTETYLCLPGATIPYPSDVQHVNWFGAKPGRCINLEIPSGEAKPNYGVKRDLVPAEIAALLRGQPEKRPVTPWLALARSLVAEEPSLSLATLSERLAVHPNHVSRSFRKAFGYSVGEFVLFQRLKKAADKAIATDDPLAEIAFDCGFYDQSHFTNAFTKATGFTPAHLRRIAHG